MRRVCIVSLLLIAQFIMSAIAYPQSDTSPRDLPPLVPNEITAIAIATAVLVPLYGAKAIEDQKPFKATLKDSVWTVEGQMPAPSWFRTTLGGVATVQIAKQDA